MAGELGRWRGGRRPAEGPLLTRRILRSLLSVELLYCVSFSHGLKRLLWWFTKLSQQSAKSGMKGGSQSGPVEPPLQGQGLLLPFPSPLSLSLEMSLPGGVTSRASAGPPSFQSSRLPSPRAFLVLPERHTLPSADSSQPPYLVLS